jgi:predicted O-methyltransferase YrrM
MKFQELESRLGKFSFITTIGPRRGRVLFDSILKMAPSECLELGFGHGTSSCYIAAALDELGSGNLTSVDMLGASEWQKPSIEELLHATGLEDRVTVVRENTSYTWFLKKKIEERSSGPSGHVCEPLYDFGFIDGAKNWTIDGAAFFLVDKLLRPGGWILFDDLNFTYQRMKDRFGVDSIDTIDLAAMGEDELETPHIDLIFRLLVMQHPHYSEFLVQDDWWAWARKVQSAKKTLVIDETRTVRTQLARALRRFAKKTLRR